MYFIYFYIFIFPSAFSRTTKIHTAETWVPMWTETEEIITTHKTPPLDTRTLAIYQREFISLETTKEDTLVTYPTEKTEQTATTEKETSVTYPSENVTKGYPASNNEYPYQVAILMKVDSDRFEFQCGGALISLSHVLTAANCIEPDNDIERFVVLYGQIELIPDFEHTVLIEQFMIYDKYSSQEGSHNIAIIYLKSRLTFSDSVQPAPIFNEFPTIDQECLVSGWRQTDGINDTYESLRGAIVTISTLCTGYDSEYPSNLYECTHNELKGACVGDTGGPLLCSTGGLVGIGRYSSQCNVYTIFTRVNNYYHWINGIIESDIDPKESSSTSLHLKEKIDLIITFILMQFIFIPSLLIQICV